LIKDRERFAAFGANQAARDGRIGLPCESIRDGLRLVLPGDQEDDPTGAAERRRCQGHPLDEGLDRTIAYFKTKI